MIRRRLLGLVILSLLFSACSGGQITRTQADVRIWLHDSDLFTGGEDAIVVGTIVDDRSIECMFLRLGDDLLPLSGRRGRASRPKSR